MKYIKIYPDDYKKLKMEMIGDTLRNEERVRNIYCKFKWWDKFELVKDNPYSIYDGYNAKTGKKYEIKSLSTCYGKYPRVIMNIHKINCGSLIRFLFDFLDGLYYIDGSIRKFERWIDIFNGKKYFMIPIEYLKLITLYN